MTIKFFIGFVWLAMFLWGFDMLVKAIRDMSADVPIWVKMVIALIFAATLPIFVLVVSVIHVVATTYRVLTHRPTPTVNERLYEIVDKIKT